MTAGRHGDGLATLPIPGLRWGDYPQRDEAADGADQAVRTPARAQRDWQPRALAVQARAARWSSLDDPAFDRLLAATRARFAQAGMQAAAIDAGAALAVEAARRTVGQSAFTSQILAALAMSSNALAEMATGEGKSLATALAAAIGALAGIPVHVLTANDYLVGRDAERFRPFFARLGLAVGTVLAPCAAPQRRLAYRCPVVYATAREVAFDYLRDRLQRDPNDAALVHRVAALTDGSRCAGDDGQSGDDGLLLRGLCLAIIDEADSVLIDDAGMPLVLSREVRDPAARVWLTQAWVLSARLSAGRDFRFTEGRRAVRLTEPGRAMLSGLTEPLAAVWKNRLHREQIVETALLARHGLARDRDYLITAGPPGQGERVELIDAVTGRIAAGRRWSLGLHGLVALKEGLQPEAELETLDRITFQRFFRRYHRLGGSSGTLHEARRELQRIYGLAIVRVPLRQPSRRRRGPTRCFSDDAARDRAVLARARALADAGRPVLIGTDSVADTQRLSALLDRAGVVHTLLDARHDADEASRVALAGRPGRITVSTNMAGRGTDIVLDPLARQAGGLHVLVCQHNASTRLDRQLLGRAARQGDPGSGEVWLSLAALRVFPPLRGEAGPQRLPIPSGLLRWLQRVVQWLSEGRAARRRARMLQADEAFDERVAFSGRR